MNSSRTAVAADRLEVDEALDQVLERIDVERIEIVGRQQPRHRAEPQALARNERKQPLDHAALQIGQVAVDAHRAPEIGEPRPRLVRPPAIEPVGEHDGIDRAGRGAGNALDLEAAVVEQLIEHAPGEGAMRAAALQREVDPPAPPFGCAPERPRRRPGTPARRRAERPRNQICEQNWKHARIDCGVRISVEGVLECGEEIVALQYEIMAVQQEAKYDEFG